MNNFGKTKIMKLYREEDIEAIGQWATQWDLYELDKEVNSKPPMFKEFIESLTPIELPSDEEIKEYNDGSTKLNPRTYYDAFQDGAKWMETQILKQNK